MADLLCWVFAVLGPEGGFCCHRSALVNVAFCSAKGKQSGGEKNSFKHGPSFQSNRVTFSISNSFEHLRDDSAFKVQFESV